MLSYKKHPFIKRTKKGFIMKKLTLLSITASILLFLSGCGGGGCDSDDCNGNGGGSNHNINDGGVIVPVINTDKRRFICIEKMTIDDKEYAATCNKLITVNGQPNSYQEIYGQLKDFQDMPIYHPDGRAYICSYGKDVIGNGVNFSSIIKQNEKLYFISEFDCAIGSIYIADVEKLSTGELVIKKDTIHFISQKDEFGGYRHQNGSVTPWESYLGSEGYAPDAKIIEEKEYALKRGEELIFDPYYEETALFWGGDLSKSNPYFYGWANEIIVDANEVPHFRKHYSMGRFSHHTQIVMPDRRTVYLSDNEEKGAIFMFIADKKNDLSVGTLYAPKEKSVKDNNQTFVEFDWINLGHISNRTMKLAISEKLKFSDILENTPPNSDLECSFDFKPVIGNSGIECIKDKATVSKTVLSRLETVRYAQLQGADLNFLYPRGLTYDSDRNRIYIAAKGYVSSLFHSNSCGFIFAGNLSSSKTDTSGEVINSNFILDKIYPILEGKKEKYPITSEYAGNECSVNYIAEPESLSYLEGKNILTIAEGGVKHINQMVWNYDLDKNKLIRIMSHPLDAHPVAINWRKDIGGFDYLIYGVQHPLINDEKASEEEKYSYIGYWGPIKTIP